MELEFSEGNINLGNFREYLLDNGIHVVLYGEFHSRHIELQEKLIQRLKPEYLLHEILWNFRLEEEKQIKETLEFYKRNPKLCEDSFDPIIGFRCYSENEHLYRWALKYGLKLVGCDLSFEEKQKFDYIEDKNIEWKAREERMGKTIIEISRLTNEPVLAIVGDTHLRDSSEIYNHLNQEVYLIRPMKFNETGVRNIDSGILIGRKYDPKPNTI